MIPVFVELTLTYVDKVIATVPYWNGGYYCQC